MTSYGKGIDMSFDMKPFLKGIDRYSKEFKKANVEAKKKVGLHFLSWILNGSSKEKVVPPIKDGILRSSGSVFVGSELVGKSPNVAQGGAATPATSSNTNNPDIVTVVFNTSYAKEMHELNWSPGKQSRKSGNVGNKFIEKHLVADKEDAMKMYAAIVKKDTNA